MKNCQDVGYKQRWKDEKMKNKRWKKEHVGYKKRWKDEKMKIWNCKTTTGWKDEKMKIIKQQVDEKLKF